MSEGFERLSIAASPKLRWAVASYVLSEGEQISPDLMNPKKATVKAAHSMVRSKVRGLFDQVAVYF